MLTVYKYPFVITDHVEIIMPAAAKILTVQMQADSPCIWALVTPDLPAVIVRRFRLAGTGHELPDNIGAHVGTFQMEGGALVFHLFEATAR